MSLGFFSGNFLNSQNTYSFDEIMKMKNQLKWENLGNIDISTAIVLWLDSFPEVTQKNYQSSMNMLVELGFLDPTMTLQKFSLMNHESVIDEIKKLKKWSEGTRQVRAASYISFTGFLSRRTEGLVRKAVPSREGVNKTFYKVREKVATNALSRAQWIKFLGELQEINPRDSLIAKLMLQGGKRVKELLSLEVEQINFEEGSIRFVQSKTKGLYKEIVVHYPKEVMELLFDYIGDRKGFVFVTRNGNRIYPMQLSRTFSKAGEKAEIPFKVTPHVLRASFITYLKGQGFSESEIMKVSGHASVDMVSSYDKSSQKDNLSKNVSLI